MHGLPALDLCDIVVQTLRSPQTIKKPSVAVSGREHDRSLCWREYDIRNWKNLERSNKVRSEIDQLNQVDHVSSNAHSSQGDSTLYLSEDNEAVIKMIIKGRSPTKRHVTRTHRVGCFTESILMPRSKSGMLTSRTNSLTLTKGSFSKKEWNNLFRLLNIMNLSMFFRSHFSYFVSDPSRNLTPVSKREQEHNFGEVSAMTKPMPTSSAQAKARPRNLVCQVSHGPCSWNERTALNNPDNPV